MVFKEKINVLLIEDNPHDTRLIKEIIKETDFKCKVHSVNKGKDALNFLNGQIKYEKTAPLDLILLDLILPDINGMEILKYIKNDSKLKLIPVVMVSMSKDQRNIDEAYKNHVNAYILKTIDYNEYMSALKSTITLYGLK